jgi:hypothetical protein
MAPDQIIALRHGEKPANAEQQSAPLDKAGPGLNERGYANRHSLTIKGWQRSGALAATRLCGLMAAPVLSEPRSLFVPRYGHTKHHRPYQTVHALALRVGAVPETPCMAGDVDTLYTRVLACEGTVVVCWEHDALIGLAALLSDEAPRDWPHGRFDVLWLFGPHGDAYGWRQAAQRLLPGDTE